MIRSIVFFVLILGGLFLTLRLLAVFLEPHLTFFPVPGLHSSPSKMGIQFQEVAIRTRDGEVVYAWLLDHPDAQTEVVFFHGNGGNLSLWQDFLINIYHQPFTVLALDYRGYGKSSGSPTEKGLYLDTEALIQYFWEEVHHQNRKVVYWGRSLGGPIAAFAGTIIQPHGLILEASFPSVQSLLNHYPILKVMSLFSRYRFPTIEWLDSLSCPVLVLHGDQDRIVPLKQGQLLFEQISSEEKHLHVIRGADHNNTQMVNPELYWERVNRFSTNLRNGQDLS